MTTLNLTQDTFASVTAGPGLVVLDFWASWCGPCRRFAPIFEAASEKHPEITFGKVDTDAEQALAAELKITSIPTLMVFQDGQLLLRQAGALGASAFEDLLQRVASPQGGGVRGRRPSGEEVAPPRITVVDTANL